MPDWSRLVRERLPALHVRPERENEIVAELALQLDQAFADAVAGGAGRGGSAAPRWHKWAIGIS